MYRIKKIQNSVTGESRYKLQVKFLFWWNDCRRELGWGCDEPIVEDSYERCARWKRIREEGDGWS